MLLLCAAKLNISIVRGKKRVVEMMWFFCAHSIDCCGFFVIFLHITSLATFQAFVPSLIIVNMELCLVGLHCSSFLVQKNETFHTAKPTKTLLYFLNTILKTHTEPKKIEWKYFSKKHAHPIYLAYIFT